MPRVPISLLVDDGCPLIHAYRWHHESVHRKAPRTDDGRLLLDYVPNDLLDRFCDVVAAHGMAGKFSIVPSPAGKGDIVRGIDGFDVALTRQWLATAAERLSPRFDFSPEGITHDLTLDLKTNRFLPVGESDWSQTQDRTTLIPYITRQLELMKAAGFAATGVTCPWVFGLDVEDEFTASVVAAQKAVNGRDFSWYFLHTLHEKPRKPWVASRVGGAVLVSIPTTVDDHYWATINSPRTDREYVDEIADRSITKDGKGGSIIDVMRAGSWPMLLTHWQSLFSNGLETGLKVLDVVGKRINDTLGAQVEWKTCMEIAALTAAGAAD